MNLKTDKFEITFCGVEDVYDVFKVRLLETNESCYIGYDYNEDCIDSIELITQVMSSTASVRKDSERNIDDFIEDINKFDFELRTIFERMHDLVYSTQEDIY